MDTKVFKNFLRNRDISQSKFDMSFKNLGTANFGALQVKGVLPVMPSDHWKIGLDSLTKVDPMAAPAFTRIMQNTYAFYVPNQCVYQHWNDYISNGSAFLDTYGNNQTNQEISDKFRPPCVPVLDLQHIAKIATGWSIPVWNLGKYFDSLFFREYNLVIGLILSHIPIYVDADFMNGYKKHLYFFHLIQGLHLAACTNFVSGAIFNKKISPLFSFAYYAPHFRFETESVSGSQSLLKIVTATLDGLCVGGSYETLQRFLSLSGLDGSDSVDYNYNTTIQPSFDQKASTDFSKFLGIDFLHFCDPTARAGSKLVAPFELVRDSTVVNGSNVVNCYNYFQNINEVEDFTDSDSYLWYFSKKSGFYGATFQVDTSLPLTSDNVFSVTIYDHFHLSPSRIPIVDNPTVPKSEYFSNFAKFFDNFPLIFRYFHHNWRSCLAALGRPQYFSEADDLHSYDSTSDSADNYQLEFATFVAPVDSSALVASDNLFSSSQVLAQNYYGNWGVVDGNRTGHLCTTIPVWSDVTVYNHPANLCSNIDFYDSESLSCGYSSLGFYLYLCKQAVMNLEKFNIPVDSFVGASFMDFYFEQIEVLPFFANSKIYNDYFRNKAVTTAELDWSHCNGSAFMNDERMRIGRNFAEYCRSEYYDPVYITRNGWVIPFETTPKNSLSESFSLGYDINDKNIIDTSLNVFHYYDVTNAIDLFRLLTGAGLKFDICHRLTQVTHSVKVVTTDYEKLYNLFISNVYLPSFYNGLLHQKYQNFNQDYFSSALLDPLSGANQVVVPDTITELRSAEKTQTFWERLAMNRSFQSFSEKVFGIKPFHSDVDKPLLLGSMHTRLQIGEVVQTSETSASSSQGTRSGLGAGHGSSGLVDRKFSEYGYIIILQSHTVEVQYFQGLEKHWVPKESFMDYPFFDFVGIGNQPIMERELNYGVNPSLNQYRPYSFTTPETPYVAGFPKGRFGGFNNPLFLTSRTSKGEALRLLANVTMPQKNVDYPELFHSSIFGYVSRFSDWKFKFDELHGEFRNTLDYWHTFRRFFIRPLLSHEFVNWEFMADDNELNRLFNVIENEISDKFKVYLKFNASVKRSLPYVCQPSM